MSITAEQRYQFFFRSSLKKYRLSRSKRKKTDVSQVSWIIGYIFKDLSEKKIVIIAIIL